MFGFALLFSMLTTAGEPNVPPPPTAQNDLIAQSAEAIANVIGLSPDGARIWKELVVERSSYDAFNRSDEIDLAIGKELAADAPDYARLAQLADERVRAAAQREQEEIDQLLDISRRLSPNDRKAVGRFLVRGAAQSLSSRKPVARVRP